VTDPLVTEIVVGDVASAVPQTGYTDAVSGDSERSESSNSRSPAKNGSGALALHVPAAGVDTWSPGWYIERDSSLARSLEELATEASARAWLLPEQVAGHRVGWFPSSGLVFAEGHPSLDEARLASPDDLPAVLEHIETEMADRGLPLPMGTAYTAWDGPGTATSTRFPGSCGVRRLDATVDLRFETPAHGLAFMNGLAAVAREAPRVQANVRFSKSRRFIETVALHGHGGRRLLARAYDKGVELGTLRPGLLLRLEDQRRFAKNGRRAPEQLDMQTVRGLWRRRFEWLRKATEGVIVTTPGQVSGAIVEMIESGQLTASQAIRVAGLLVLEHDLSRVAVSERSMYRHRALVRETGLVMTGGLLDEVEVDLHALVETILDSEAWSQRGCQLTLPGVEQAPRSLQHTTRCVLDSAEGPAGQPESYWLSAN
jgi:hypothetical protein